MGNYVITIFIYFFSNKLFKEKKSIYPYINLLNTIPILLFILFPINYNKFR